MRRAAGSAVGVRKVRLEQPLEPPAASAPRRVRVCALHSNVRVRKLGVMNILGYYKRYSRACGIIHIFPLSHKHGACSCTLLHLRAFPARARHQS